jgi:hypothetical protein
MGWPYFDQDKVCGLDPPPPAAPRTRTQAFSVTDHAFNVTFSHYIRTALST